MDGVIDGNAGVLLQVKQALPILNELRAVLPALAELREVMPLLAEIRCLLAAPQAAREWYSVEEAAKLLGKSAYTVREYCREGRINARKRSERRGGAELWNVSAAEITRIKDEGFLSPDRSRNAGR